MYIQYVCAAVRSRFDRVTEPFESLAWASMEGLPAQELGG